MSNSSQVPKPSYEVLFRKIYYLENIWYKQNKIKLMNNIKTILKFPSAKPLFWKP